MTNTEHPVWRLLTTVVYLGFGTLFLWLNASNFDKTEIKTIVELAAVMAVGEGVKSRLKKEHPKQ